MFFVVDVGIFIFSSGSILHFEGWIQTSQNFMGDAAVVCAWLLLGGVGWSQDKVLDLELGNPIPSRVKRSRRRLPDFSVHGWLARIEEIKYIK